MRGGGYLDRLVNGVPVADLSGKIIKSVQRGVCSTNSAQNITISLVNVNKSILIVCGGAGSNSYGSDHLVGEITSASNIKLRPVLNNNYVSGAWQVIEFW